MRRDSAADFDRWAPAYHDCVLQPLILADVFDPRQNLFSRLRGRPILPQVLTRPALSAIGLDVRTTEHVAGIGALAVITVITAQRKS